MCQSEAFDGWEMPENDCRNFPHRSEKISGMPSIWCRLGSSLYVLHAFMKKSKRGIATPKREIDLIKARLRRAKEMAQAEAQNHE